MFHLPPIAALLAVLALPRPCEAQQLEPARFRRAEVEFASGPRRLRGTLLVPEVSLPLPAVVVLGGSDRGPRGRAKSALAGAIAAVGIAALSYDSPGTGSSTGDALLQTRGDRAAEASAAVAFLRARKDIDPQRVGVVGGSEGARVALFSAGRDEAVACVVAISGAFGITMLDLARYRIDAMGLRVGLTHAQVQKAHVLEELLFALMSGQDVIEWRILRAQADTFDDAGWRTLFELIPRCRGELTAAQRKSLWDELRAVLRRWAPEPWFALAVVDRANFERVLAVDANSFFTLIERGPLARGDWFESREELHAFAQVRRPVLAVWGEEDDFVPPRRSAAWLRANLTATEDVTLRLVPGGDHSLFAVGTTGHVPGYPQLVVDWLRTRLAADRGR
ncbi:MAG: alpha/beta fold hydrolase [Planctomycetota bacterium]